MNLKKICIASTAAMILAFGGTTAFAHHGGGHHGYYYAPQPQISYQSCAYTDCTSTDVHTHTGDDCYYYGHYQNDGHNHCANTTNCYRSYCHNH